MKYLLLAFIFLIVNKSNAQIHVNNYDTMITLSPTGSWSVMYLNVPVIEKMNDGTFKIKGDSLTAIKQLWNELELRDREHNKNIEDWSRSYKKLAYDYQNYLKSQREFMIKLKRLNQ